MSNLNITKSLKNIRKEVKRLNDLKDGLINLILGKIKLKSSTRSIEDHIVSFGKDVEKLTLLDEQIVQYYFEQFNKYTFFYENSGCIKLNENIFKPTNNGKYCFKPVKEEIGKVSYEKLEKILNTLKNTKIQYNAQSSNNEGSVAENNNNEGSGSRNSQLTRLMNKYSSVLEKDDLEVLKNILESKNINLNNINEINEIIKKIQIKKIELLIGPNKTSKTVSFYDGQSYENLKNSLPSRNDLIEIYKAAASSPRFKIRENIINEFKRQIFFKKYLLNKIFKGTPSYDKINRLIDGLITDIPPNLSSSNYYRQLQNEMNALYTLYGNSLIQARNNRLIIIKQKDIFGRATSVAGIVNMFNNLLPKKKQSNIKNYEGLVNYIKKNPNKDIQNMFTYAELLNLLPKQKK